MREEERIRKERLKMEEEFKMEENKKKAKFNEVQKANAQLISNKDVVVPGKRKNKVIDEDDNHNNFSNYVVEKQGPKLDLFGKSPSIMDQ